MPSFSLSGVGGATPHLIFCTSVGSIGLIASLNGETSKLLNDVERNMRRVVKPIGGLKQQE